MCVFGLFAFFLARALPRQPFSAPKTTALAFILTCIYALSDEFHQLFVPGRAFELLDIALDSLGALAGALLWHFTHAPRQAQPRDLPKP